MKTYYYIAFRKPRGLKRRYAGDGIWQANSIAQARKEIASARGVPAKLIEIQLKKETVGLSSF